MKDFLGTEINVGDSVVAMKYRGTSSFLYKGIVSKITDKGMIKIKAEKNSAEWGLCETMRVSNYKTIVINDLIKN